MKSALCLVVVLVLCGANRVAADCCGSPNCCSHCGCQCCCQKVCRLVPATKKVPKVDYSCECEDFCVPGRSCHTVVCDECGNKQDCYTPTCGKVYTRVKLVKTETMVEKPGYKCVVEYLCDGCSQNCNCDNAQNSAGKGDVVRRTGETLQASYQQPEANAGPAATEPAKAKTPSTIRRMLQPIFGK